MPRLALGFIGAEAAMPYARAILTELRAQYPGITVDMRELNLSEQFRALTSGEVDAAFLRPPLPPGIQSLHLATESRVACLPANDPLATEPALTLAQLADHLVVDVPPELPRAW